MSVTILLEQGDGLTLREVLSDIPYDPAAVFVYIMLAVFAGFIWWGTRRDSGGTAVGPRGASSKVPPSSTRKDLEDKP